MPHIHTDDATTTKGTVKPRAVAALSEGVETMAALPDKLYAQDKWAVLLIFQAMDAAGKGGVVKHIMSGLNPQGCQVASFKAPLTEELGHDFPWRCQRNLPEHGRIVVASAVIDELASLDRHYCAVTPRSAGISP